ncbi:MAG: hypothetical protein RJB66_2241 [Pseudomonadota bacterium]|jgi:hypothetical protein
MLKKITSIGLLFGIVLSGCSSSHKARRQERERLVQSKGVFCDFVSESDFNDVDVELNLRLAKKCDASKPFSITSHKRVSENPGVLYCCNSEGVEAHVDTAPVAPSAQPAAPASAPAPAKEDKSKDSSAK